MLQNTRSNLMPLFVLKHGVLWFLQFTKGINIGIDNYDFLS